MTPWLDRLRQLGNRAWPFVARYGRNFYVATAGALAIWMLFFDSNDLFTQARTLNRLRLARAERDYYAQKIEQVHAERRAVLDDPRALERFARERYLMKRPGEDLYLVVDEIEPTDD